MPCRENVPCRVNIAVVSDTAHQGTSTLLFQDLLYLSDYWWRFSRSTNKSGWYMLH